ncbi:hypothetical protein [Dickeya fangzhongdai]|uniref:hypothetical protein n=1 Tax=Dickeya fangzhongdai TaxID=1778540 RepID=UPI000A48B51A|nr:hypothetical protein [Dickeya fangzhongdai]
MTHHGLAYRRDAVKNTHHARQPGDHRQNTRELWHCLEGLSIDPFDPDAAANWIRHYPGGLTFAE